MLYFMPGQMSFVPTNGEPTDTPWTCGNPSCKKQWRDADLDLEKEQQIVNAVVNTYFNVVPGTIQVPHLLFWRAGCGGKGQGD